MSLTDILIENSDIDITEASKQQLAYRLGQATILLMEGLEREQRQIEANGKLLTLLKDAERERDELRQQLEARDKDKQPMEMKLSPAEAIADAMGRQSKEKFEKAWKAGRPHFCTIGEGEDDELQWTVKCRGCTYERMYLSYDMATLMKDAHDSKDSQADPYAELLDYEAEPVAYQWLRVHGLIRCIGKAEFVKLTEDNAGLILAALPEQVSAVRKQEVAEYLFLRHPPHNYEYEYDEGTWLRVESDHLTPATDEESKALEGEEQ